MLEDFRSHDPSPTREEHEWMAADPFSAVLHIAALAAVAIAIGLAATGLTQEEPRPATVAATPSE